MDIGIRADGMTTSDFENFAIEIVKKKFDNSSLHGFKEGMMVLTALMILLLPLSLSKLNAGR